MIITLVGGGSTFTPGIVKSIALRREELEVTEVRLFDIDKERQDKVAVVVDWILHQELKCDIKLTVTNDPETAYTDASFIFAQMRVGKYAMREQDEKIPLRHGCVGQETCGCGGMAYGMRTIFPMMQEPPGSGAVPGGRPPADSGQHPPQARRPESSAPAISGR